MALPRSSPGGGWNEEDTLRGQVTGGTLGSSSPWALPESPGPLEVRGPSRI